MLDESSWYCPVDLDYQRHWILDAKVLANYVLGRQRPLSLISDNMAARSKAFDNVNCVLLCRSQSRSELIVASIALRCIHWRI